MTSKPQTLGVVLGGASVEHTISIRSAQAVLSAADPERWRPIPFAVSRSGRWLTPQESQAALSAIDHGAPGRDPRTHRPSPNADGTRHHLGPARLRRRFPP